MPKTKNEQLTNWEKATNELAKYFIKRYFGKDTENWWVGSEIGDVIFINDFFFSIQDITQFIRRNYSEEDIFKFYDLRLEKQTKGETFININHWKKLKKSKICSTKLKIS